MLERQQSGMTLYVYRALGSSGQLLYVGRTDDLVRRFKLHLKRAHWVWQVEAITVERFSTEAEQRRCEVGAIYSEHPIWNVQHVRNFKQASRDRLAAEIVDAPLHTFDEWLAVSRKINALTQAIHQETVYQGETQP